MTIKAISRLSYTFHDWTIILIRATAAKATAV
jgi:hypothetical protein